MACFPGLMRGAGSPAGSSAVRERAGSPGPAVAGRPRPRSTVLSGLGLLIHDELQAHPEGFRGAEESFQRRVQVPTISRSAWRPFCRMQIAWLTELA